MRTGNGAVIVKDKRIVSTGYNGTPFGLGNCNEGICPRCLNFSVDVSDDLDKCLCLHAVESAILEAGRPRTLGTTIYTTKFPCQLCIKMVIQAGIVRLVFQQHTNHKLAKQMLDLTNIEMV